MWAQVASSVLGMWLMAAPQMLHYQGAARLNDHIMGPLVAAFGCIAIWDVTRSLRWVNTILGAWLVLAPWLLGYQWPVVLHSIILGILLIALSLVRGRLQEQFAGGWMVLWRGRTDRGNR